MSEHSNIVKKIEEEFTPPKKDDWKQVAEQSLKGKPLENISSLNYEGINVLPIYSQEDIGTINRTVSDSPGVFPFVRGNSNEGYKKKSWDISQSVIAKDAKEFNQKLKEYLTRGQTAVSIFTNAELGISNFYPKNTDEFKKAFDGIDLNNLPINVFAGKKALVYLEIIDKYLKENKFGWEDIKGGIDFDPIRNLVIDGALDDSIEDEFLKLDSFLKKTKNSKYYPIAVNGLPYREGGSNAIQELAFTLATALYYIRQLSLNFEIDDIAQKIRFILSTGNDFFVEIAKIRAIRLLWAKMINEFGGNEDSQKLNLYIKSLEMNKSSLDIYVNMLRNTTEALGAIIGGCDTLELLNFDFLQKSLNENEGQKIEFSERVTRNTQLVLAEECLLKEVTDPAGGSYYIEYLTSEIAKKSWELFQEVEKRGGIIEALKQGFPQEEVAKFRNQRIRNLATRKDVLLGANKFPNLADSVPVTVNNEARHTNQNSQLITPVKKFRASEVFENLRKKAIEFKRNTGRSPRVFICAYGPLSKHKARVDFTTDFLHVGGIETEYQVFSTYEDAAKGFLESEMNVIVFCSADELYEDFVPQLSRLIKKAKPLTKVILAGYPNDKIEEYKNAGVDEFIHIKADIVTVLNDIYGDLN